MVCQRIHEVLTERASMNGHALRDFAEMLSRNLGFDFIEKSITQKLIEQEAAKNMTVSENDVDLMYISENPASRSSRNPIPSPIVHPWNATSFYWSDVLPFTMFSTEKEVSGLDYGHELGLLRSIVAAFRELGGTSCLVLQCINGLDDLESALLEMDVEESLWEFDIIISLHKVHEKSAMSGTVIIAFSPHEEKVQLLHGIGDHKALTEEWVKEVCFFACRLSVL